jgi:hypothetical protein
MPVRIVFGMLFAVLCSGCSTKDGRNMPLVHGKDIELRFRSTQHFWDAEAIKQLAAQKPEVLDSPLNLERGSKPFIQEESEITVRFAIDSHGNVIDTHVLRIVTGYAGEDIIQQTLGALSLWHFYPPVRGGTPTGYCCAKLIIENY